ncbi:MAG TPA: OFA family MFS transporter [Aliidongia sp.]|uniref:OFA family MFS transporter n=1 Tax=Aliidongia sp. TaxID=1914230 RepID=UPI002DDCDAE8|nr:OFA family MFS transporter [Aliidongia sp.]HEV2675237.1 OFA family MFS transporter [Aliidongia sp.]
MTELVEQDRTIAGSGYSRWQAPAAALAIHLSIGQIYAFSVFNEPLTHLIGVTQAAPDDWSLTTIGWVFSTAIGVLGLSAALFGRWADRVGPRQTAVAAALCFGSGFLIAAFGVEAHVYALLFLGYGVIGGCGLGLGYIAPISTLIKWFPDRPGQATGLAIMGFGGGALIAAPLAQRLIGLFATEVSLGVSETFACMGVLYTGFMLLGAANLKQPPPDWVAPQRPRETILGAQRGPPKAVTVGMAVRQRQFYLMSAILCLNVTAGIGVLSQAALMCQEMFPEVTSAGAAGFVGLLGLFNMAGRLAWSTISDQLGRRPTYAIFTGLGLCLYGLIPSTGQAGSITLFIAGYAVIMSMYGGAFATLPAYIRDVFGAHQVGAIHGRLLLSWSVAGLIGPALVNYLRRAEIEHGVPHADAYSLVMYVMAGLLAAGFVCNALMRPLPRPVWTTRPDA